MYCACKVHLTARLAFTDLSIYSVHRNNKTVNSYEIDEFQYWWFSPSTVLMYKFMWYTYAQQRVRIFRQRKEIYRATDFYLS